MILILTLNALFNFLVTIGGPPLPVPSFEQLAAQKIQWLQAERRELLYYQLDYQGKPGTDWSVEADWAERRVEVWIWTEEMSRFSGADDRPQHGKRFRQVLQRGRDLASLRMEVENGGGKYLLLVAAI